MTKCVYCVTGGCLQHGTPELPECSHLPTLPTSHGEWEKIEQEIRSDYKNILSPKQIEATVAWWREKANNLLSSQLTSLEVEVRGLQKKTGKGWREIHNLVEAEDGYLKAIKDATELIKSRRGGEHVKYM